MASEGKKVALPSYDIKAIDSAIEAMGRAREMAQRPSLLDLPEVNRIMVTAIKSLSVWDVMELYRLAGIGRETERSRR